MAYDRQSIESQCLQVIEEERLTQFTDLAIYVAPSRATLYEWELDKSDKIKAALDKNKLLAKKKLRNRWHESDNATLQIAAYRLMADDDEIERLTVNKVDAKLNHSGGVTVVSRPANYETK